MRSVKGATAPPIAATDHLTTTLWQRARTNPSVPLLRHPVGSGWQTVTAAQLADRVRAVAAGLVAAGVGKGDRVALISGTRVEWTIADLAILAAGAVSVPIYETSSRSQCQWILADSGAALAFAATSDDAKLLAAARTDADLREVVVFDDGGLDLLAERADDDDRAAVDERLAAIGADDLASLIYTSGTTGNPKGCAMTHRNLLSATRGVLEPLDELLGEGQSSLLFLPLAHVFARVIQFALLETATVLGYARSVETLLEDLQTFRPTFLLAVPRLFEKVYGGARRKATGAKAKVFDFAVATAQQYCANAPARPGAVVRVKRAVADRLVYAKLREALGGRVRYCISGGAPLAAHLACFFHAAGITILEGYGLTETSAATAVNTPDAFRLGTVGRPLDGVEIGVTGDGELLVRGPQVFAGYWQNEPATREVLDADGWFHTGDLGDIDADGFVHISGRQKELIVTAAGKNVAPAVLEERLTTHRLVSQAVVVGDNRPFVAALIALDPDELAALAADHRLTGTPAELSASPVIREEIAAAVAHANAAVSKAESIRKIAVVDREFSSDHGEVTPSLKLRRAVIAQNFRDEIEGLYPQRT